MGSMNAAVIQLRVDDPVRPVTEILRRYVSDAICAGLPIRIDRLTCEDAQGLWQLVYDKGATPVMSRQIGDLWIVRSSSAMLG